jgi:hypothetical protein
VAAECLVRLKASAWLDPGAIKPDEIAIDPCQILAELIGRLINSSKSGW